MRRATIILALLAAVAILAGASPRPGTYQTSDGVDQFASGTYRVAGVDTVKILVHDGDYPNTAAEGEGWIYSANSYGFYDYVNDASATNDYDVRYGLVRYANPTTVYPVGLLGGEHDIFVTSGGGEDDRYPLQSVERYSLVSYNLADCGLSQGMKVEEAYIYLNRNANWSFTTGSEFHARLDTLASDYSILDGVGANNPARFNCAWRYTDAADSTNTYWTPQLKPLQDDDPDGRDDMHDFGPRSDVGITAANQPTATGGAARIEVTTALQQYLDLGMPCGETVLFVIYGVKGTSNPSVSFVAGNTATVGTRGGNPAMTVVASTRRGAKAWGDGKLPVAFTWDDAQQEQANWTATQGAFSWESALSLHRDGMVTYAWVDSLHQIQPSWMYLCSHGRKNEVIGSFTGTPLLYRLYRDWMTEQFTATIDTTEVVDFVWGGGTGERYSWEAISALVDLGYRSGRADADIGANTKVGEVSMLAWDWPVNIYHFKSRTCTDIFEDGGSPTTDQDYMREALMDLVDEYYTDYGRSAVMLHAHSNASNGVSPAGLLAFRSMISNLNCAKLANYSAVLDQRIGAFMDPADITEVNGYTAELEAAASRAKADTLSNGNELKIWLAPK